MDGTLLTVIGAFVIGGVVIKGVMRGRVVHGCVVHGAPVPEAFGQAAFGSAPPTVSEAVRRADVGKGLTSMMLEVLRSVP
jgi:hypothetical protein